MYGDHTFPSTLKAFIILAMLLGQIFRMVLCVVDVLTVRTRRNFPGKSITPTCFEKVSCPTTIVGPSMEKERDEYIVGGDVVGFLFFYFCPGDGEISSGVTFRGAVEMIYKSDPMAGYTCVGIAPR
jgi:hypothetical protein